MFLKSVKNAFPKKRISGPLLGHFERLKSSMKMTKNHGFLRDSHRDDCSIPRKGRPRFFDEKRWLSLPAAEPQKSKIPDYFGFTKSPRES